MTKNIHTLKSQQGFTLIEVVLFIIITGLLASTLLLSFYTSLEKMPTVHQQMIAAQTARRCMEWFIGQRRMNGYSTIPCPSTSVPAFCTAPSGYTMSVNIVCTTLNSDANYKTVTVTVSGNGDAVLTTLLAAY
ncbi:MAG: type II secretion system protein [Gammaproteobacteria bacterium]|nr:type II secretion system protein [Gammaproteobacteria bacterium]